MDAPRTLPDKQPVEDLTVFLVLAMPIFAVTALIVVVILTLGPR